MRPTRRTLLGTAASIGIAGCLGGDDGAADQEPTETARPSLSPTTAGESPTGAATVQVDTHDELGDILVGPDGSTLYMFDQDTQGEAASTCYDDCAAAWPPLTVDGTPTAGDGVTADLETLEREGGTTQVIANG